MHRPDWFDWITIGNKYVVLTEPQELNTWLRWDMVDDTGQVHLWYDKCWTWEKV